jgi:hypothetical protein
MIHPNEWMAAHLRNQKLTSRLRLRSSKVVIARSDELCKDCACHIEWSQLHTRR